MPLVMPEERRLAAIMFTDIVGYTALMGENEPKALRLLEKNRDIQKPLIKMYHGQFLKEMGDGILASFNSVSDAVHCAQQILKISKEEPDLKLHIGIHLGEVIFSEGDVYGDGVNIASRIESTAKEGEIFISEDVWKNIKNKEDLPVEFVGKKTFKNVKDPVGLYRLKGEPGSIKETPAKPKVRGLRLSQIGLIAVFVALCIVAFFVIKEYLLTEPTQSPVAMEKSIAVLPLQNISDEENDYLAGGIQSEIANALRNVPEIKVYAGMDVDQMVLQNLTKKEIGKRLGVAGILEGTIWKEENRFKLSLFMTEIETDEILWKDSYDREYDRLMNVVSEIAVDLSESIQVVLTSEERSNINLLPTTSPEAYDLNLNGWQLRTQAFTFAGDRDSLRSAAKDLVNKALQYDPDYISPNLLLALIELDLDNYDTVRVLGEGLIRKFPESYAGYLVMGDLHYWESGNYEEAFKYYWKAYTIEPNIHWINVQLGNIYCYVKKDYVKGLPYLIRGGELPPMPGTQTFFLWVAMAFRSIGDYEKALQWSSRALDHSQTDEHLQYVLLDHILLDMESQFLFLLDSLCGGAVFKNCYKLYFYAHVHHGNIEQAAELMENVNLGREWLVGYWIANLNLKIGDSQEAKDLLDNLKKEIQAYYVEGKIVWYPWPAFMLACVHELLGDKQAALEWLRKWERTGFLFGTHDLMMKPGYFESMRNDPEFIALYERVQKEKAEIRALVREAE
jgi:class 3 adenylate cyclase/TolB-like protein